MTELINARNNLKNVLKRRRLEKLGIAEYWEPVTSVISNLENAIIESNNKTENTLKDISKQLMLTLPNGEKLAIDKPLEENDIPEDEKLLWNKILTLPNKKGENGTLRFSEDKNGNRFYHASNRTLALNNNLVLTSTDGKHIKLNESLCELFFKSYPDTEKINKEDIVIYRKFLKDNGVKLSTTTKKQKLLDEFSTKSGSAIILPDDPKKLKDRLQVLLASKKEGHNNVFDEANEILKILLHKKIITTDEYKDTLKNI